MGIGPHHLADASKTLPAEVQAAVERLERTAAWLREKYVAVENGTMVDGQKVYDDFRTLLAHLRRTEAGR